MSRAAVPLSAILLSAILLAGCATAPAKSSGTNQHATLDWPALFASYGSTPEETGEAERAKLQSIFTANAGSCAGSAAETIEREFSTREQFCGAADAAGYLKAESCLPALEAGLRNTDWFRRFACANAIDSIDSPSSGAAVLPALGAESHGLVAMALAMYLARHPSAEAQKMLERKSGEFAGRSDDEALIAQIFIEDALEAGRRQPQ